MRPQMFGRKFQRLAEEHAAKGAVFLEIMGDETLETRVSKADPVHSSMHAVRHILFACMRCVRRWENHENHGFLSCSSLAAEC